MGTVATRKDQLDAFSFARRRMVANLVVPTPTGSDEGAPRPIKTFASSIILSAIAVAAVAVLGVFKPSAPSGWQNGLAVDSSTGAAYIDQNNELHAVYNITSARLILGTKFAKYDVPDSTLNGSGTTIGSPVGILGAPEDVPSASSMNLTQWSFCQHETSSADETVPGGASYLEVGYAPVASTTQGLWTSSGESDAQGSNWALIVHDSEDNVYLIDGDYKYEIGNDKTDQSDVQKLLVAINQNRNFVSTDVTGFWVSDAWLEAFQPGAQITYPQLNTPLGSSVTGSNQPGNKVGEYGENVSGTGGSVQTSNGLVELSPFAYNLYQANKNLSANGIKPFTQGPLSQSTINNANGSTAPSPTSAFTSDSYGADWPTVAPNLIGDDTSEANTQNLCVGFDGQWSGGVPQLTTWVSAQLPYGTAGSQFGLNQTSADNEATTVLVKPGSGVIAQRSSDGTGTGIQYLIEDSGYRYALATDATSSSSSGSSSSSSCTSALCLLGYSSVKSEPVPANWVNLIQGGATLDPDQAGLTPETGN